MVESERLARILFSRSQRGAQAGSVPLLHPDAEIAPSHDPTSTISASEFARHVVSRDVPRVISAHAQRYLPLDDDRIIVEGQVVLREAGRGGTGYRSVVWAMTFRNGLLYRSWAVSSVREAEVQLGVELVTTTNVA